MTEPAKEVSSRSQVGRNPGDSSKRELILEAAARLFLSRGFEGTSMDRVAEESGAGRRTVYNQFASKKALFDATVERVWDRMAIDRIVSKAGISGNPSATLAEIGQAIADFWAPEEAIAFVRMVIAESKQFPELAQSFFDAGKAPALAVVSDYFELLNRAGTLKIDDPDLAARQFVGLINEPLLWFRVIGVGQAPSEERRAYVVQEAVRTFLCRFENGTQPQKPERRSSASDRI